MTPPFPYHRNQTRQPPKRRKLIYPAPAGFMDDCPACDGLGICPHCNGSMYSEDGNMDDGYRCPHCRKFPGKCSCCEGTGRA
jgi:primosomal protein N'